MEQEKPKLKLIETWTIEKYDGDVVAPEFLTETITLTFDDEGNQIQKVVVGKEE